MKHETTKTMRVSYILSVIFVLFCAFTLLPQIVQATNTVIATIPVGSAPWGVAVSPNSAYVYVTNNGGNSVSVIDTTTNTVIATIPVGSAPCDVAVSPNGAYAYVTNQGGSVSVINTATNTVTATIPVARNPWGVAVSPNGTYVYVTNDSGCSVTVIDTATNTVTKTITISVGGETRGVAVSPNGAYIYVVDWGWSSVSVIDTTTNMVTATIPVGTSPCGVAVSHNGAYTYVASDGGASVSVIDTTTNMVTATIPIGTSGVAVSPNSAYAYVRNQGGSVSVIDTTTNMVTATIPIGTSGVAVSPNSAYVYVTNNGGNSVSVISTLTITVSPTSWTMDVGQSKIFTASASGGSGVYSSYQWYVGGVVQNGKTASTFSFVPASTGSYLVTVTVTDSLGVTSPQSSAATVSVAASPNVNIVSVGPVVMDIGQVQAFTATLVGGSGAISYQWYLDGNAVGTNSSSYTYIASGTSAAITCKVTDSASVPVTSPASNATTITVNTALVAPTTSTLSGIIDQGQTSRLTSSAISTGTSPYSYQWLSKTPGASAYSIISGAISDSYSFVTSGSTFTGDWSFKLQVTDNASASVTVTSTAVSVTVNIAPTVSVSPSSWIMDVGQSKTFTATASGGSGVYSSYQWYIGGVSQSSQNTQTFSFTSNSVATYLVTVAVTDSLGATSTQSSGAAVTITKSTYISISVDAPSVTVGSAVNIKGSLLDLFGNRLQTKIVTLSYTFAGSTSWIPISSGTTNVAGEYNIQWVNTASGTFTMKAEWIGNAEFLGASNSTSISFLPAENQNVFFVESNSTVTALAFNSTSSELSFAVSGTSGTTGYVKATIAKSLVQNAENIKVYLDGNQLTYQVTSNANAWLLTFTYHHSIHQVSIDLTAAASTPSPTTAPANSSSPNTTTSPTPTLPEFPTWIILPLFAVIILLSAVFARKRTPKK